MPTTIGILVARAMMTGDVSRAQALANGRTTWSVPEARAILGAGRTIAARYGAPIDVGMSVLGWKRFTAYDVAPSVRRPVLVSAADPCPSVDAALKASLAKAASTKPAAKASKRPMKPLSKTALAAFRRRGGSLVDHVKNGCRRIHCPVCG